MATAESTAQHHAAIIALYDDVMRFAGEVVGHNQGVDVDILPPADSLANLTIETRLLATPALAAPKGDFSEPPRVSYFLQDTGRIAVGVLGDKGEISPLTTDDLKAAAEWWRTKPEDIARIVGDADYARVSHETNVTVPCGPDFTVNAFAEVKTRLNDGLQTRARGLALWAPKAARTSLAFNTMLRNDDTGALFGISYRNPKTGFIVSPTHADLEDIVIPKLTSARDDLAAFCTRVATLA